VRVRSLGGDPHRLALAAICAFVLVLGAWNVLRYPPGAGYDAADHMDYADGLVFEGRFPQGTGEFHTPPGYHAVAGVLDWLAESLGAGEPHRAGMALNVLFSLGTVLLVWQLAREIWPGRHRLALAAAAFAALLPAAVKAGAMFHPEPMSTFLCTLALWLCVRSFADRRYVLALGVTLGVAQLVRAWALWTVLAVLIAFVLARRWRELAVVVALAVLIPAPWYVHQRVEYGRVFAFNRPEPTEPFLERRPARFFFDPGIPEVVTTPYRPHFLNRSLPTTYAELWGDYFGAWVWKGLGTPSVEARRELQRQSLVGLLPTAVAFVGWLAFLLRSGRSPPRLAVALLPLLGIVGYLYFTVRYPSPDGDVLKGSFMLSTTAGWALGFGYALDRLRGLKLWVVLALLAAGALVQLPFLVYG
jgi:4-amino-4-deoxy-L-arabinose transferase-like glycosyltransferase